MIGAPGEVNPLPGTPLEFDRRAGDRRVRRRLVPGALAHRASSPPGPPMPPVRRAPPPSPSAMRRGGAPMPSVTARCCWICRAIRAPARASSDRLRRRCHHASRRSGRRSPGVSGAHRFRHPARRSGRRQLHRRGSLPADRRAERRRARLLRRCGQRHRRIRWGGDGDRLGVRRPRCPRRGHRGPRRHRRRRRSHRRAGDGRGFRGNRLPRAVEPDGRRGPHTRGGGPRHRRHRAVPHRLQHVESPHGHARLEVPGAPGVHRGRLRCGGHGIRQRHRPAGLPHADAQLRLQRRWHVDRDRIGGRRVRG